MHRDERNFSYPHTYYPDRWLIAAGLQAAPEKEPLVHTPAAFLPFSVGPANCVGKGLALLEMRVVVCAVMQRLALRLDPARRAQRALHRSHVERRLALGAAVDRRACVAFARAQEHGC